MRCSQSTAGLRQGKGIDQFQGNLRPPPGSDFAAPSVFSSAMLSMSRIRGTDGARISVATPCGADLTRCTRCA